MTSALQQPPHAKRTSTGKKTPSPMPARARSTPLRVKNRWPPRQRFTDSPRVKTSSASSRSPTSASSSSSGRSRRAVGSMKSASRSGRSAVLARSPLGLFVLAKKAKAKAKTRSTRKHEKHQRKSRSAPRRAASAATAAGRRLRARASVRIEQLGSDDVVQRFRAVRVLPGGAILGQEIRIRRRLQKPARAFAPRRRSIPTRTPLQVLP